MENKPKMKNRLNPFSLDKIKNTKKNPIMIKKKNLELNILPKNKKINNQTENTFLNNTLNYFRKSNSFITKDNINKKQLYLSNDKIYDNLKESMEKELKLINSEQHIHNITKMFEIFQNELFYQLGEKYNQSEIKNILHKNLGNIIKYLSNYFRQYENKYSNFKLNLNQLINKLKIKEKENSINNNKLNNYKNSNQIINNYTHNNNNIIIFDENKKKHFLNEEENIVNLINSLSSNIRICNKKYKLSLINIANLIDFSNNKLIEIKKNLEFINEKILSKLDFKCINEIKEINNIYLVNINIITEIKILDDNQKIFFDEAKEIFNNLKINHKIKIKKYQKLFESIQNIRSKSSSKSKEKSLNCYYTFNNLSLFKNNKNKKFYDLNHEKREKSLPNEVKTNKNELKYLKLNFNNNRTRNLNNILNETKISYNNRNNSYNLTNSFNNSNANSFNTTNNIISLKLKEEDNNKINNFLINNNKFKNENSNEIYYLAENIMNFFNKMNNLQLSIINKKPNINQQKRDFEIFKKRLIEYSKNIIDKKARNNNNKIYENIKFDNKSLENKNSFFKFDINKLQLIFNEKFNIISITKDNQQNKNSNNQKEKIIDLVNKNKKELTKEIIKKEDDILKKEKKEKNENIILKKFFIHFLDLIKNKLKELENLNLSQKELNELLNLFYKNKENKNNDDNLDIELINKIINNFEIYFNELIDNIKVLKKDNEKLIKESQDNLIKADKYKESLDKALLNKNNEKENINDKINPQEKDKNYNIKSKINLIVDKDGELSFKEESFKISNNIIVNEDESNKYISTLLDDNVTGSFPNNNNSNMNRLNNSNSKRSNDKKIINNESYEENKIMLKDENNEINNKDNFDYLDINKDLLKYLNNLKNKIKLLEKEVESLKNKNFNFFLEIKNELYDFNEEKISLSKYNNLIKLYEKEQETNKNLEKNYITLIEKINKNLLIYFKKMNCEFEIESKEKNIITNSQESIKNDKIKNDDLIKRNNLHFDYSNLFKAKSILKLNEDNENKNEKIDNDNYNKELKIKNLIEENISLKKNEKLLLEQLSIIKNEIKELNLKIEKKDEKIKYLNQDLERKFILQKDKLYIPLRNGLEKLITEINLTNKIKDLLRDLLKISLYNNEEIEKIFNYKEKKKNIIGIFRL